MGPLGREMRMGIWKVRVRPCLRACACLNVQMPLTPGLCLYLDMTPALSSHMFCFLVSSTSKRLKCLKRTQRTKLESLHLWSWPGGRCGYLSVI
jgi:hypothetical protein